MSVTDTIRSAPLGAVSTVRIVAFFERAFETFTAWRSARATATALAGLSDKQLADIGLNRGDITEVADTLAHR